MKKNSTGIQLVLLSGLKFWNQGISLIRTMFMSRVFTLTEYGTYTKLLLILDFAFSFIVLNVPSCANYFVSKSNSENQRKEFVFTYYVLCTIIGVILGISLVLLSPLLSIALNNGEIAKYAWYLGFTSLFQIITKATSYILTSHNKSSKAVVISFVFSLFSIIGLIISYYSNNPFKTCLIIMLIIDFVYTIVGYIVGYKFVNGSDKKNNDKIRFNFKTVKAIYKYIVPVGFSSIILILNTRIDKVIVSLTESNEFYAIYANASKELPVAALSVAVASIIIPKLVRLLRNGDTDKALKLWKSTLSLTMFISIFLMSGVFIFAEDVMTLIYSSKYLDGLYIFKVYLFLIPFHLIEFSLLLSANGKTKFILISSIISLIVNIILDFILLKLFGIIGLAYATIIATIIMSYLQLYFSAKSLNVKIKDVFPIQNVFMLLMINLMFSIIFYFIKLLLPLDDYVGSLIESISLALIWGILYFIALRKIVYKSWRELNSIQ